MLFYLEGCYNLNLKVDGHRECLMALLFFIPVNSQISKLLLNTQELVVFGHTVGPA